MAAATRKRSSRLAAAAACTPIVLVSSSTRRDELQVRLFVGRRCAAALPNLLCRARVFAPAARCRRLISHARGQILRPERDFMALFTDLQTA